MLEDSELVAVDAHFKARKEAGDAGAGGQKFLVHSIWAVRNLVREKKAGGENEPFEDWDIEKIIAAGTGGPVHL